MTTHQYPLGFQMALNGYAITLKAWNQLKPDQQTKLQAAFTTLIDDIWVYSKELTQDALNCNAGKEPCTTGKKFKLVEVAGPAGRHRTGPQGRCHDLAAHLGRDLRQVQPRLLGRLEEDGRRCWG